DGVLPKHFAVVGFGSRKADDADAWFRERARDGVRHFSRRPLDETLFADFAKMLHYVVGDYDDGRTYATLRTRLEELDRKLSIPGGRVYYLAVPPDLVPPCVANLREAGLVRDPGEAAAFGRVIVEKPVGNDLASARTVMETVGRVFAEEQTFRI